MSPDKESLLTLAGCSQLHLLQKKLNLFAFHLFSDSRGFSEKATNHLRSNLMDISGNGLVSVLKDKLIQLVPVRRWLLNF